MDKSNDEMCDAFSWFGGRLNQRFNHNPTCTLRGVAIGGRLWHHTWLNIIFLQLLLGPGFKFLGHCEGLFVLDKNWKISALWGRSSFWSLMVMGCTLHTPIGLERLTLKHLSYWSNDKTEFSYNGKEWTFFVTIIHVKKTIERLLW